MIDQVCNCSDILPCAIVHLSQVELRAFCLKHSEAENHTSSQCTGDMLVPVGSDSKNQVLIQSANKTHKINVGSRNGDKIAVNIETDNLNVNAYNLNNSVLHVDGFPDNRSNSKVQSEFVDLQQHVNNDRVGMGTTDDANASGPLNLSIIVGKVPSIICFLKALSRGFFDVLLETRNSYLLFFLVNQSRES